MATKPERIYLRDMPQRQPLKRELKMYQIIRQLQSAPIVQLACERAGVSRAAYYRWRTNDVIFARAADHVLEAGRFLINDMAESQLIRKVKNGDGSAIKYWLSHNHPNYSKKYIHVPCHTCETKSTEEKHREERRDLRNFEIVTKGISEKLSGEIDDRHEHAAHEVEDWMFERFEMLDDETGVNESSDGASGGAAQK